MGVIHTQTVIGDSKHRVITIRQGDVDGLSGRVDFATRMCGIDAVYSIGDPFTQYRV